jgi:hypothetical protein
MQSIIIGSIYGGLGDNLQFSQIPEVAHNIGIQCYVSRKSKFRNKETADLVWELNPYVFWTDEEPNLTEDDYIKATGNIITDWHIKVFGGETPITPRRPKLYYEPKHIAEYEDQIIIDANAISIECDFQKVIDKLTPLNPIIINDNHKYEHNLRRLYTKNIFDYTNIIASAKGFVCQNSGPTQIMAAYGKKADVYMNDKDMANNTFFMDMHYYQSIESI